MSIASALIFGTILWRMGRSQTSIQDRMGLLQVPRPLGLVLRLELLMGLECLAFNKVIQRINFTFWDELAHVAFQDVEKGNQIYVSGSLLSDTVESDDGKQQIYYKVVVQQLNFVEKSSSSVNLYDGDSNSVTPGRKNGNYTANNTGSTEQLWQAFFANPLDWWDNRKNKRSPNYPDFKHKDTGEALWVEGRYNPPWVKSQLAILDSRMESFHDKTASMSLNFMAGDNYKPF